MRWILLSLILVGVQTQAATLLCGEDPCEDVDTIETAWPDAGAQGVLLQVEPSITMEVPNGYESMRQFRSTISYFYPTDQDQEKLLYVFTVVIPHEQVGGPVGGWTDLYRAEKGDLIVYYYQDHTGDLRYNATVRNLHDERNDIAGRVHYLEIGAQGFEKEEFLEIVGSVKPLSSSW